MSVIVNASTSTGLGITSDNSGIVEIQSNGTTKLTVASTGVYGTVTTATAQASTSGTAIDFTSIPSWVKRITVMFNNVSTNGTSIVQVQLGTGSTTYTTTGYTSSAASISGAPGTGTLASGFGLEWSTAASAANTRYGQIIVSNVSSNIWVVSGSCYTSGTYQTVFGGGISLAAALTAVRITTVSGTDTFDAGSINIMYEG